MTTATATATVGPLLRDWRQRRRMSQLDLAVEAEVSARHLSFVETGRSRPSRELVLHLADHLEVPLRERNSLLLAAGYAPVYPASSLDSEEMTPVRDALDRLLRGHEPFPAIVVDRRWDLVAANGSALGILSDGVAPALLEPPINTLRVSLHPEGLAPRIANLADYGAHLLHRLHRQAIAAGDPDLFALLEELRDLSGLAPTPAGSTELLFVPLVLRGDPQLTFLSTLTTFGTALDVTMAELAIEAFFPADDVTVAELSQPRSGSTATASQKATASSS
jgi:transcriptional regulator with XRE-family HTH domain